MRSHSTFSTGRLAIAACLATTLAGCATLGNAPVERQLPPVPDYARPVEIADPKEGEDALAVAARERAGRIANAKTIIRMDSWYLCVRDEYAAKRREKVKACQ